MQRKRRIRRLSVAGLLFAIVLPFLAFGLSNLYLISPKGRLFIASKIKLRTGLETSVQGASWSPWNGFTLYGVRVEQPTQLSTELMAPLLSVESVQVAPAWWPLLSRRHLLVQDIDIRKPKINVPVELLTLIPNSPPDPALVVNNTQQPNILPESIPAPTPERTENQPPPEAPVIVSQPQAEKTIPKNPTEESSPPTVWVNFSDAEIRVVSTFTKEPLYEILNADGGLPIGGKPAKKNITIRQVRSFGNIIGANISIPLKWTSPVLGIGAINGKFFGMDCSVKAEIGLAHGMPFQISAVLPEQKDRELHWGGDIRAKLGTFSGTGRMQGFLGSSATWQGQWIVQSASVEATHEDKHTSFDYGQALVIFRNGALSCIDARLVGDSMSILGNATLLSDGRAAANARIIAAPDFLVAISKFTQPSSSAPALTPLSTPQRSALDLQVFGKIGEFFYKSNPSAAPVPLQ